MDTADHIAFLEEMYNDEATPFSEKMAIEEELIEYYHCLAVVQEALENEQLSEDELANAWQEYQELTA